MSHRINNVAYKEGVFVGYRWYEAKKIEPLYHFGHGLSYTSFEYKTLKLPATAIPLGSGFNVEFTVTNTGRVAGAEIVQVYVRDTKSAVPRPERELKGFTKITLQPGESRAVSVRLTTKEFAYWDVTAHGWKTEPHEYTVLVGGASDALPLEGPVTLQ